MNNQGKVKLSNLAITLLSSYQQIGGTCKKIPRESSGSPLAVVIGYTLVMPWVGLVSSDEICVHVGD